MGARGKAAFFANAGRRLASGVGGHHLVGRVGVDLTAAPLALRPDRVVEFGAEARGYGVDAEVLENGQRQAEQSGQRAWKGVKRATFDTTCNNGQVERRAVPHVDEGLLTVGPGKGDAQCWA